MREKVYNLEDRLVQFAGEIIFYVRTIPNDSTGFYLFDQVQRSASSSALNYGEAQGTQTTRDFINKMSLVLKELKETKVALKILAYIDYGDSNKRSNLLSEAAELIAICFQNDPEQKEDLIFDFDFHFDFDLNL